MSTADEHEKSPLERVAEEDAPVVTGRQDRYGTQDDEELGSRDSEYEADTTAGALSGATGSSDDDPDGTQDDDGGRNPSW